MNQDLFLAILAMDVYHRGYNPGLMTDGRAAVTGSQIGNATVSVALGGTDDNTNRSAVDQAAQDIGFYAQSYTLGSETIIAYRGTDNGINNLTPTAKDQIYGYGLSIGNGTADQALMAIDFYRQVLAGQAGTDPRTANITITGQSLGGGLAGYVGAIYNRPTTVFNYMPFWLGANNAYSEALGWEDEFGQPQYNAALRSQIYGDLQPWSPTLTNVNAVIVSGEALDYTTFLRVANQERVLETHANMYDIGAVQRHTSSTIVLTMFAEDNSYVDWYPVAGDMWRGIFNAAIGQAIGLTAADGNQSIPQNAWTEDYIMAVMIAYSAVDEGYKPFGDSAIRALFDDVTDIGFAIEGSANPFLETNPILVGINNTVKAGLADIAVQYAGDLALQKATDSDSKAGVFELLDGDTKLKADLDPQKWINTFNIGVGADGNNRSGGQEKIVGIDKIATALIATMAAESSGSSQAAITQAAQKFKTDAGEGYRNITWLEAAAKTGGVTIAEPENAHPTLPGPGGQQSNDPGGAILIGGYGADTITGSKGHDLIVGGDNADTFFWSGGNDLVFGGKGDDKYQLGKGDPLPGAITFFGGEGDDVLVAPAGSGSKLYGGEGKDIIVGWSGIDELYGNDGDSANDNAPDLIARVA